MLHITPLPHLAAQTRRSHAPRYPASHRQIATGTPITGRITSHMAHSGRLKNALVSRDNHLSFDGALGGLRASAARLPVLALRSRLFIAPTASNSEQRHHLGNNQASTDIAIAAMLSVNASFGLCRLSIQLSAHSKGWPVYHFFLISSCVAMTPFLRNSS